jgi:hypothetical protein
MRNLVAAPVILLAVIIQSAIVSRVYLLSLPLVMLAAWALQHEVKTAWHWAVATGLLVGFVSGLAWFVPVIGYLIVVTLAQLLQRRIWQAPLLAMFVVTFLGTIVLYLLSFATLQLSGVPLSAADTLGLLTLPGVLLNLLLAIPAYAVMRDLSRWVYPSSEVE